MDRLDRIRIFQMVADRSTFAEASRKLGIAPVAATRAVAALEKDPMQMNIIVKFA